MSQGEVAALYASRLPPPPPSRSHRAEAGAAAPAAAAEVAADRMGATAAGRMEAVGSATPITAAAARSHPRLPPDRPAPPPARGLRRARGRVGLGGWSGRGLHAGRWQRDADTNRDTDDQFIFFIRLTMSGRASIGGARDDASSAASAASQAAAGRGLRRRADPLRDRSRGERRQLGRLAPPGRGPLRPLRGQASATCRPPPAACNTRTALRYRWSAAATTAWRRQGPLARILRRR